MNQTYLLRINRTKVKLCLPPHISTVHRQGRCKWFSSLNEQYFTTSFGLSQPCRTERRVTLPTEYLMTPRRRETYKFWIDFWHNVSDMCVARVAYPPTPIRLLINKYRKVHSVAENVWLQFVLTAHVHFKLNALNVASEASLSSALKHSRPNSTESSRCEAEAAAKILPRIIFYNIVSYTHIFFISGWAVFMCVLTLWLMAAAVETLFVFILKFYSFHFVAVRGSAVCETQRQYRLNV